MVRRKQFVDREIKTNIKKETAFKVLLIGFDGISQTGLKRGLPNSNKKLSAKDNWFEMEGYTRVN
jgi:Protein of unknown function (DUF229)